MNKMNSKKYKSKVSNLLCFATALMLMVGHTLAIDFSYETYKIRDRETLDDIANKLVKNYPAKYNGRVEDYKSDLKIWNKHISDWNQLIEGTKIYIENPFPVFVGGSDYAPSLGTTNEETTYLSSYRVTDFFEESKTERRLNLNAFYMASAGSFVETVPNEEGQITSKQNSPYSIGVGGGYVFGDMTHSLSGSVYWSSLRASDLSGDVVSSSNTLEVPEEIGYNLYYQYLVKNWGLGFYGGVDKEKFSTFNTRDILVGQELAIVSNDLTYATLGMAKTFYLGDYKFLSRASFATSVASTSTSTRGDAQFEGNRMLLFLSMRGSYNLSYHLLYKRHQLTGPTNLTIDRVGIGIGYQFY